MDKRYPFLAPSPWLQRDWTADESDDEYLMSYDEILRGLKFPPKQACGFMQLELDRTQTRCLPELPIQERMQPTQQLIAYHQGFKLLLPWFDRQLEPLRQNENTPTPIKGSGFAWHMSVAVEHWKQGAGRIAIGHMNRACLFVHNPEHDYLFGHLAEETRKVCNRLRAALIQAAGVPILVGLPSLAKSAFRDLVRFGALIYEDLGWNRNFREDWAKSCCGVLSFRNAAIADIKPEVVYDSRQVVIGNCGTLLTPSQIPTDQLKQQLLDIWKRAFHDRPFDVHRLSGLGADRCTLAAPAFPALRAEYLRRTDHVQDHDHVGRRHAAG